MPGKYLVISDLLSRNFPVKPRVPEIKDINEVVHSINVSDEKKEIFKKETGKDPVLSELIKVLENGWPENKSQLNEKIKYFWKFRGDIFLEDNIVFLNNRIVVPTALQEEILRKLHEPHLRIVKTKERARSLVYWPGLNEAINIDTQISKNH